MPKPDDLNGGQAEIGQNRAPMAHANTQPENHIGGDRLNLRRHLGQIPGLSFALEELHFIIKAPHRGVGLAFFGQQHQPEALAELAQILAEIAILHMVGMHDLSRDQQRGAIRAQARRRQVGIAQANSAAPIAQ